MRFLLTLSLLALAIALAGNSPASAKGGGKSSSGSHDGGGKGHHFGGRDQITVINDSDCDYYHRKLQERGSRFWKSKIANECS